MEEGAGLLDALPCNGHGDVLILDQVIALGCLVGHDPVVLSAVAIQIIPHAPASEYCAESPRHSAAGC